MMMQTIQMWLNKLFARWPWKRSSAIASPRVASNVSKGVTPEQMWRSVVEASQPQAGITSVIVEHGVEESMLGSQSQPLPGDELVERVSPAAKQDEQPLIPRALPGATGKDTPTVSNNVRISSARYEQPLEFLRYLVQQGVVNEGFAEGQVPAQYQAKQEK